ncbi:MAG: hypothetical protein HYX95_03265 [Chloroflexi bacterium]|nr:hypothetical protein [Chloroflexota bacterium]
MQTRPYSREAPRSYGRATGLRLIAVLEAVGADPFTIVQAVDQSATLGLTPRHTLTLLNRLSVGAWVTRIKRGVYAINDPVTKLPKAHPFAIGAALVAPSAVSHWSALQHWGLTEQVPATIMLSSPRRTFPHVGEAQSGRPAWLVSGVRYEVVAVAKPRFFGIADVWVSERDRVPIFDRERALLDAFHHFHIFGSLSVALEILEAHLEDIDVPRLVQYAQQLRVGAAVKRVGWALDSLGVPPETLSPLRSYPAKGDSPLDPGHPARGRHNPTWRVIENLRDG